MLLFPDGAAFATGALRYRYQPIGQQAQDNRVLLDVIVEGLITTTVLDTGAPYVMIAPALATQLGINGSDAIETTSIRHRSMQLDGGLHRVEMRFPARYGETLAIQATAFVPDLNFLEQWGDLPCFLGMSGCLERLRFAIDPGHDMFYFGPL